MADTRLSIITPTLNCAGFIRDNLRSVHLNQGESLEIEQIVADGMSTDGTLEIVEEFREKFGANIRILKGPDNSLYEAINKGMLQIKGEFWGCLNADDYYIPRSVPLVLSQFEKYREAEAIYCNLERIDGSGRHLFYHFLPEFDICYLIMKRYCANIFQPATILRASVIGKVGFFRADVSYKHVADYDYMIRLGLQCKLHRLPIFLTRFRDHSESRSVIPWIRKIQAAQGLKISQDYAHRVRCSEARLFANDLSMLVHQVKPGNLRYLATRGSARISTLFGRKMVP